MLKIPDAGQFGGKSNIPANVTQSDWLAVVKNRSCIGCHQLGQLSTRTIPASLGQFESSEKAWIRRVQSGQAADLMLNPLTEVLGGVPFKYFGDWTDRVAKGELPHSKPPRPQGVERNIVVTTWEWGDPKKYLHDLIASDRRYPTVNAHGQLYGSPEYATDDYPILDPKTHTVTTFRAPVRDRRHAGGARARPRRAREADGAVAVLGRREDLGQQGQQPQRHVRPEGPGLVRGDRARPEEPELLPEGLGPSLGQAVPAGADEPRASRSSIRRR